MSDYEVGYGKPPEAGKIKKGECRNPNGRGGKKKSSLNNTAKAIIERLDQEIIRVGDRKMTRREAELRMLQTKALHGDMKAIQILNDMREKAEATDTSKGGVLVVPGVRPLEEWSTAAMRHQAKYRSASYAAGTDHPDNTDETPNP